MEKASVFALCIIVVGGLQVALPSVVWRSFCRRVAGLVDPALPEVKSDVRQLVVVLCSAGALTMVFGVVVFFVGWSLTVAIILQVALWCLMMIVIFPIGRRLDNNNQGLWAEIERPG